MRKPKPSYCVVSEHEDGTTPRVVGPFASIDEAREWHRNRQSADHGWSHWVFEIQPPNAR